MPSKPLIISIINIISILTPPFLRYLSSDFGKVGRFAKKLLNIWPTHLIDAGAFQKLTRFSRDSPSITVENSLAF